MSAATSTPVGASFVVPVHNGAASIADALASIFLQADGRPIEVIVVDDHSRDDSAAIVASIGIAWPVRLLSSESRGAAAALNTGVRAARFPIICQVDQDVVLKPGWMARLLAAFDDPKVGAAQGYYETDVDAGLCARVMSLDLEHRYAAIRSDEIDHVCTGNSAYRVDALRRIGLFDESLGYGYDNDASYRLRAAGYRLAFVRAARSSHRWRDTPVGYFWQQYGFGYGRLDVVAKHPTRLAGDAVSPARMMSHPMLTFGGLLGLCCALLLRLTGGPSLIVASASLFLLAALAAERLAAGIVAAVRFRQPAPLLFPLFHFVRDVAWVAAIGAWTARRALKRPALPEHSMMPGAR
jgi:cellulose synthase/poly-beta-1,6-N-acetylglucosamine synthase-like glycosyltransferase